MISLDRLEEAVHRIRDRVEKTPLTYDSENSLYLKWENRQITGSFKIRGAFNKVLSMQPHELESGLVTASAGNYGQGDALAAREVGVPVNVFASEHAVPAKLEAMRSLGAQVILTPRGYAEAEKAALADAATRQAAWVSPYNDMDVIAGQASLVFELVEQTSSWQEIKALVVPAGGGGLVSGIGLALQAFSAQAGGHRPRLIAVQSEASPFLYDLYHQGSQAHAVELDSLADGLAGPVEPGSVTISWAQRLVDDFVLVSEEQIAHAVAFAWQRYGERIEGSAAAALAAALSGTVKERPAVIILSGGNIQPELHERLCARSYGEWKEVSEK